METFSTPPLNKSPDWQFDGSVKLILKVHIPLGPRLTPVHVSLLIKNGGLLNCDSSSLRVSDVPVPVFETV